MAGIERIVNKINTSLKFTGVRLSRAVAPRKFPIELNDQEIEILNYVLDNELTMVSLERLISTLMSCKYAIENNVPGDFVECGVWRGGNALIASEMIRLLGSEKRVYLFDTFEGMTAPSELDKTHSNQPASPQYEKFAKENHNSWCYSSLEEVKLNFFKRNLLNDNLVFVKGDVLQTLKVNQNIPESISVLRLDTDWYASTKMELEILFPKLSLGGFLIIDDYGHWQGSRKAVEEYFNINTPKPFFHCSDLVGRIGIKIE